MTMQALLSAASAQAAGRGDLPNDNRILEGTIVEGTYDPIGMINGKIAMPTVQVIIDDQYAAATTDDPSELLSVRATLATTQIGDAAGPVGGERVMLFRLQNGWSAVMEHGPDDTPKTPAGERWIANRNLQGEVIGFVKWTLDGAAAGDARGGFAILSAFASAGAEFKDLESTAAAYTLGDIQSLVQSLIAQTLQSMMASLGTAIVAAWSLPTPLERALALDAVIAAEGWVLENVAPPNIPTGAPRFRISPE